mmetsp:Transcript_24365/g.34164  ORF Transcript_24365/g.34164 Transcript_24365/m.34164 type:complete len:359 (+) Transcript_24365:109-1185(+)
MVRKDTKQSNNQPPQSWESSEEYFTTGTGERSYELKYSILDQKEASQICVWNNYVVTASNRETMAMGSICIWKTSGKLVHSEPIWYGVKSMIVWDDILVVGSQRLEFWKLEKSHKMTCEFSSEKPVLSAIVWNNLLYTLSEASRIIVWDHTGKLLRSIPNVSDSFSATLVVNGFLWTADKITGIKIWKQKKDRGMEVVKQFKEQPYKRVICLFLWKQNRVVSTSDSFPSQVQIWGAEGEKLSCYEFQVWSRSSTIWQGKLALGTSDGWMLVNENGSLAQTVQPRAEHTSTTKQIFSDGDKLWQITSGYIMMWSFAADWNVQRLLWLAVKKNLPSDCHLARLPRELITLIISLLNHVGL